MTKWKDLPRTTRYLCSRWICENFTTRIPFALKVMIIKFYFTQQQISKDDIIFSTDPQSPNSFTFSTILMAFLIDHTSNSPSSTIIKLSKDTKIFISLYSTKFNLNNSSENHQIYTISRKEWKVENVKYIYYIELTRPTLCDCDNTDGLLKIWIVPYKQDINTETGYWNQILDLTNFNSALIKIDLSKERINWTQKIEFDIISNNSKSMQFWINKSEESWVWEQTSERRFCCQPAMEQYKNA